MVEQKLSFYRKQLQQSVDAMFKDIKYDFSMQLEIERRNEDVGRKDSKSSRGRRKKGSCGTTA
jgi:hypothetical protein